MDDLLYKWCGRLNLFRPAKEMLVISKWLYRFKNSQRRDKSYQKLHRIKRDFQRYFEQNLHSEITDRVKQTLEQNQLLDGSMASSTDTVLLSIFDRLSNCIKYVETFLDFMESAFNDLMERIQICHNIPMYIIVTSSLSRVWLLMKLHMQSLTELYQLVSKLRPLPSQPIPKPLSPCIVFKQGPSDKKQVFNIKNASMSSPEVITKEDVIKETINSEHKVSKKLIKLKILRRQNMKTKKKLKTTKKRLKKRNVKLTRVSHDNLKMSRDIHYRSLQDHDIQCKSHKQLFNNQESIDDIFSIIQS